MKTATTREVQHHFSKVLDWVEAGEEVIVTRRGEDVALIVPVESVEDVLDQPIDWCDSVRSRNDSLMTLPQMKRNAVLQMREEERY